MLGILIDENGNLIINPVRDAAGLIASGVEIGNIDYLRCNLIIQSQKGEIKEYPTLGFGLDNYLKGGNGLKDKQMFIVELTKELKSDGINGRISINENLSKFEIEVL